MKRQKVKRNNNFLIFDFLRFTFDTALCLNFLSTTRPAGTNRIGRQPG
ncbi:MAG: hypothetical protein JWQ40_3973 [Segetibacter sp.]|nr:hypothetical protein [Segetibacter sp.]